MVTIEQKVKLFSKLIYQEVDYDIQEKQTLMKQEQSEILERATQAAKKQANEILRANEYRVGEQHSKAIGKAKIENKREILKAREACVTKMLQKLESKISAFIETPDYEKYIKNCIQKSTKMMEVGTPLRAVVSKADAKRLKVMLERYNFSIEIAQQPIMGGIIIVDPKNNTQVDFSFDTTLKDKLPVITGAIMTELEEVGEKIE